MTALAVETLSAASFELFGRVVERPGAAPDATGPAWRWWADTVLVPSDGRPVGIGYLDLSPGDLSFDWAERHVRSVEVIVPLGGDCLAYVAPKGDLSDDGATPERDGFRVFRIPTGSGIAMEPGVWHGAPFALGEPSRAIVLLLQGTGAADTRIVRFEQPISIAEGD
jgi:ureidoglycolate hydrolase